MSEADLSRAVQDIARLFRWRLFHSWTSVHSPAGFPDLVLCRPPRLLMVELKREAGKLTQAQAEWMFDLGRCEGVEAAIWRPSDLDSGLIERTLR
jgi:hypothetical protein